MVALYLKGEVIKLLFQQANAPDPIEKKTNLISVTQNKKILHKNVESTSLVKLSPKDVYCIFIFINDSCSLHWSIYLFDVHNFYALREY